ncbi:MAG: acyltransferase [Clostridiales bacterium]|nr:acyltransferase [Clostridiales bacterium]
MGYRKFMSVLISIVMVVVFASAAVSADSKEKKCTTPSGITLTMPKEFHSILWPGIEDNDPALAESGYTKEMLSQLYTKSGVEFQASRSVKDVKYGINVLIYELDTPKDLKASFADKIMTPGSVKAEDLIGYGMVKIMGVPLYKIVYQSSAAPGDTVIRLHQYSLLTKSGKMHQINIMLMNDPQNKTGQVPYTEEDYRLLNLVAANIIGSIELSKELAPDVKSPEGAAPYRMTTGKASEYRNITTTSGITLTVSSDFLYPLWPGIDENDPVLSWLSINKKQVEEMYKLGGVEFQCSKTLDHDDDKYIEVIIFERDTPSDLNQSFSKEIQPMSPNSFGSSDMFGYGLTEKAGVPIYRIAYQTTGDNTLRLNQYTLVTKSGKMHQINIMLISDPAKNIKTYTDEDIKTLEEVTESIMGSLKLSDDLAADVTTPEGAEPFKMAVGEEPSVGPRYNLLSGITVSLPSEFAVLWDSMSKDDPIFAEQNIDYETAVKAEFEKYECELTAGDIYGEHAYRTDKEWFMVAVFENDSPSDLSESSLYSHFADNLQVYYPRSLNTTDLLGYGTVKVNGIDFFKVFYQNSASSSEKVRLYQYSFNCGNGKKYQINIALASTESPFSDQACKHLDYLAGYIINSVRLSEGLSGQVKASDIASYRMVTGDYAPSASVEGGNSDASAVQPGTNADSKSTVNTFSSFFSSFTSWNIPTFVILIALALILLIGIKPSKLREWQEEPLSLDKSKAIQGFAAVCIIVHHLSQELAEQAGAIGFFQGLGVLFVGIFFFFSGYGLYTSLKTKDNYLKGFLKKRFVTILVPFYVCNLIFVAASCICGEKYKPLQLLYVLSGWSLINMHMWYIVEIAILYIVFFLIYRLIKNRTAATVVMSVFVLAMMTGSLMLCHGEDMSCSYWFQGEWWYNASFLFVIGIIFSKHAEGLRKIARKGYYLLLLVFAALTAVLGLQTNYLLVKYSYWSEIPGQDPKYLDKFHCLAFQLPWIFCFVCLLLLIMMKVRFGNPVLKFLGSISLELYLIHNLFLKGLQDGTVFRVKSPGMYVILTILMAVGFATVISGFDKYLLSLITGKKKAAEPALKAGSHIHSIDVMRIVMAFLVVAIHLPFSDKAGDVFITYGKTAVPFFLVICGYFLYRDDSKEMMKRLIKQTKRIFIFYVAANVFYAGLYAIYLKVTEGSFDGMCECFTSKALLDFLLYNFSPFSEHLWYLGSLLYALLIMLLLNKLKIMKFAMFTAPLLVAGYVVLSHLGIGTGIQLRNAILVGLGYTMMGMIIRRFEKKILDHKATAPVLWIVFIICCVTAIFELNGYKQGIAVPFVSCEILVYVIALLCLKYPDFGAGTFAEWLGRECSLTVYIVHMAVIMLMNMTGNNGFFGKYGAVTVFVITTVIAALYKSIKNAVTDKKQ